MDTSTEKTKLTPKQAEVVHHLSEGAELIPVAPADPEARRYYRLKKGDEIVMREVNRKVVNNLLRKRRLVRVEENGRPKYRLRNSEAPPAPDTEPVQISIFTPDTGTGTWSVGYNHLPTTYQIPKPPDQIYKTDL